jgi:peroxiredoxin (alkyl hydroperoxide reductase subunit C)
MEHVEEPARLPRIGEPAPDFEAKSSHGPVSLSQYRGRWLMLFSHPNDFTPVCSTEIMEFARRYDEFQQRGIDLLGLSVDGVPAHIAWMKNMGEMLGRPIPFPIIADVDMAVAKKYGMIHPGDALTETVRAVFFIDDGGIVRALLYYPLSTGRSVDELLRVFDSLQVKASLNYATPVDWHAGDPVVVPAPASLDKVETPAEASAKGLEYREWYLRLTNPR